MRFTFTDEFYISEEELEMIAWRVKYNNWSLEASIFSYKEKVWI